jgi:hypothetical protein
VAQTNARGEIYAGGWHIASYAASTTQFNHTDWLGTVRVRTGPTGAVINSYTSLPFGDCFDQNGGSTCDGLVARRPPTSPTRTAMPKPASTTSSIDSIRPCRAGG